MKLNSSIWKPKVDRIDDLLSEQPTYSEKEAFFRAKVDHFVGVQMKDYSSFISEVVDHLLSAIGDDPTLVSKDDFLKAYYNVLIDDFGGAKGLRQQAYKKFRLESKSVTQGFYKWSQKLIGSHIVVIGAIAAMLSSNSNNETIFYAIYPFCFVLGGATMIYSARYFKKAKTQEVFKNIPVYKYEASNILMPIVCLIPLVASIFKPQGDDPLFYTMTIVTWFGTYYAILYFFFLKDKIEDSSDELSLMQDFRR